MMTATATRAGTFLAGAIVGVTIFLAVAFAQIYVLQGFNLFP
jgi:hypothetical protein